MAGSFTIGEFEESVAKDELGWRVRAHADDVPVIFVLQRQAFTDRFQVREDVQREFRARWGHVQAACALAYEKWSGRKRRVPTHETIIPLLAEHFLVD